MRDDDLNIDPARVAELVTAADEGDPARRTSPASRPTSTRCSALGLPVVEDAAHAAESALPRPQARRGSPTRRASRSTRRRTSPPARAGCRDEPRRRRRRRSTTCASCAAATARSTTSPSPATRRTSPTCSRRSRSSSSTSSSGTREIRARQFALYDDGRRGARRDRAARARPARHARASTSTSCAIDAERAGATRDEYQRALADENIGTSSTSCRCTGSPPTASASRDQPPLPGRRARGRRGAVAAALARALRRRHRATRSTRCAACTTRFTRMKRAAPPRRRRSSSPASRPPTSSGRSTSARRCTSSRTPISATSCAAVAIMFAHGLADGLALAAAAAARGHPRPPRLADARVLRLLHGRPDAADRRSAATPSRIYETARRHPGQAAPIAGSVLLERALGGAATLLSPRSASRSRSATTTSAPTSGSRSRSSSLTMIARRRRSSRARARPLLRRLVPLLRRLRLERPIRARLRGHPRATATTPALLARRVRADARWCRQCACSRSGLAGKAVGVDLSPRPYYVMGPLLFLVMLVPFTVNGLAVRESFFVSFLGKLGVERGRGLRDRLPLLPRDARARAAGRGDLGWEAVRGRRAPTRPRRRSRWTSPSSSSRTTRCRGSSSASRACADTRRSSSTTARPTARSSSCASASREARLIEQENKGLGGRLQRGHARGARRDYFLLLNSDAWVVGDAVERLVAFADAHPQRRGRRAAPAQSRTARSSARCAASRRSGGSRPSTSSCASSRRARAR